MSAQTPPPPPYRELTVAGAVIGVLIGAVMTAAFVYVALKLGFGMSGSSVAAILGFGVLRGLLRRGTIVENNINQTIASGVNNASSGVAFTLPALFILSQQNPDLADFSVTPILLSALAGTFLGIVFIIPLRKQMIELERLRFPSGIAVATLLKSPGAGARQAKLLVGGFAVAMAFHVLLELGFLPQDLDLGAAFGLPGWFPIALGVSFASIGAGLLSGAGGLPFVFGALLAWWIISPLAVSLGWVPTPAELGVEASADFEDFLMGPIVYFNMLRPLGIGILIGGALSGVIASFPAIRAALRGLSAAGRSGSGSDELSSRVLTVGVALALVVLFLAAYLSSDTIGVGRAIIIALVGTFWLALAGLIVAQAAGMTDISPISGMSLIGVTLMFFLSGGDVEVSIILGVAVSIGIGQCADMMGDLKSGHLIGALPKRQQIAQFAFGWIGVPIAVGVLYMLWGEGGGGFGPSVPELSAPQGSALAAIIESLQQGASPLDKYIAGAGLGLALGVYPIGGLGVLIGLAMYLPLAITLTYGVGCVFNMWLVRKRGEAWVGKTIVPIAAGFIIGEALTSLTAVLIRLSLG